ncbi:hypothetical protein MMC25_006513 [Agyrium rufum]|nr:hypothetical protein [Agyrium rufum]
MEGLNISELVDRLGSDEDAVRKMAAFKLQSNIGDPSFADVFISDGGLAKLRYLALHANGNTLAYTLASFSRLLEIDKGWEFITQELVQRIVELVVSNPLVNILRGAMSMLAAIVSHPYNSTNSITQPDAFGSRALRPAVAQHDNFLEMLVIRLSSADHMLCTSALLLINSLMRDAVSEDSETEWPKFIKRLQDLGVIRAVYNLMQSSALQDLASPLLEFQGLTKVLLRKWREANIDLEKPEHRRALKGIHLGSNPPKIEDMDASGKRGHNPEKWRRLGFNTESPAFEFDHVGFLGMMDLADYARKHEDSYQKVLLEQSAQPVEERCPMAHASLSVTQILYEHFEIEKSELEDTKGYFVLDSRSSIDKTFKPLILQWSKLHSSGLQAYLRLWKATGAERTDISKITELVRILIEAVVGGALRTKDIKEVEEELRDFEYERLRELQMELLELTYEDAWGHHLRQVRDELDHEALQFIKEQRIRCLLQGAWFPMTAAPVVIKDQVVGVSLTKDELRKAASPTWRFTKLSHNRRWLHWRDFTDREENDPPLENLHEKIDLSTVSSVVSNVSASPSTTANTHSRTDSQASASTLRQAKPHPAPTNTKITINTYASSNISHGQPHHKHTNSSSSRKELPLLTLHPPTHSLASEFLDGLLMLLNQQPITAETNKLVRLVSGYGFRIRLLNVRFEELGPAREVEMPSRDGVDEDFYYEDFNG